MREPLMGEVEFLRKELRKERAEVAQLRSEREKLLDAVERFAKDKNAVRLWLQKEVYA